MTRADVGKRVAGFLGLFVMLVAAIAWSSGEKDLVLAMWRGLQVVGMIGLAGGVFSVSLLCVAALIGTFDKGNHQ